MHIFDCQQLSENLVWEKIGLELHKGDNTQEQGDTSDM